MWYFIIGLAGFIVGWFIHGLCSSTRNAEADAQANFWHRKWAEKVEESQDAARRKAGGDNA